MRGTMMDYPLTLIHILERAGRLFRNVEIVSRLPDHSVHRYTYGDFHHRVRALAEALQKAGLRRGDRVATLMWNHYVHLEAYFGIPAAGGVTHTLNLRLHPDELAYIFNHAEDRFAIVDDVLLPVFEQFKARVNPERVIVAGLGRALPQSWESYEQFLAQATGDFSYPKLDENEAAAMCYTSGTTGKPKGVVYSHRTLVLHSFAIALPDSLSVGQRDVVMALAPMFHANSHGMPFAAVMVGSKLVFPGRYMDAESVLQLLESERVTATTAVPTVWLGMLEALDRSPCRWKLAPGLRGVGGGATVAESMIRGFERHGVRLIHCWGMTETTPLATASNLKSYMERWPEEQQYAVRARQGRPAPFVEIRAARFVGEVPWDGMTSGELQVRGPWVAASYYNLPEESGRWTEDGWLRTGDMATIDSEGYIRIVDRTKDMIKSGGEWISSVDLESTLMSHPTVKEAAVIAVPHPKWQERPLALVVLKQAARVTPDELYSHLAQKHAKWQLPDAFVFVEEIPQTSTGKMLKAKLREQYRNWRWTD